MDGINIIDMLIGLGAGLAIFFFGVYEMTLGMREAAADRVRSVLERFTKNRVTAVGVGAGATAVVGSSSIVTIMTVGLVSTGLLAFQSSIGVVMGANIGTTLSSQIVAFGLTDFFGVVLIIGAVLRFVVRTDHAKAWGIAIMGVGFVFLGLEQIEAAMTPLRSSKVFMGAIRQMESPLIGILIGAAITAVIQSSSATMGVVIILAGQGAITLPAGIAIMMGAELGTCVDTLLSTIGQSRDAVRTGVFQLMFNAFNVLLLVSFTAQLAEIAKWMTQGSGAQDIAKQIAHAHVMFNCFGVLAALPFTRLMAAGMLRLIPPPGEKVSAFGVPLVPVSALARAEGENARQERDREYDPTADEYTAHERV
ncbi:MAG: Na/Pi symporter [Polyangiales bacterium]